MRLNKRLTKEDFFKLKQLDRIEYRQRYDLIERNRPDFGPMGFLVDMFAIIGFVLIVSLLMYNINLEAFATIFLLIPILLKLTMIIFVILFFFEILSIILYNKKVKELNAEYFKLDLKVKR